MLSALDFFLDEPVRAVIVGDPARAETRALLRAIHGVYRPGKIVLGAQGPVDPFARTLPAGKSPQVFLCTGTACQSPTSDPEKIKAMLG